jgi:16S rRNA (adenine1518-N6/adenine1519-N6)-dimethyltransferase
VRVVDAIAPRPGDVFLEVGPGTGALTLPLAASGAPILAVEVDRRLVAGLLPRVPPNVTVLAGDVLTLDVIPYLTGLEPQRTPGSGLRPPRRFRVVGNLPYVIASPILFRLLALQRQDACFTDATVMVQREVADRLLAPPGTKEYGVLTVLVGLQATLTRVLDVPAGAFRPVPQVRSTVVRLTFGTRRVSVSDPALFERLVKALFSQRRKTLTNALKRFDPSGPAVVALAGLDGQRRPETLTIQDLARLSDLVAAVRRPAVL